MIYFFDSSALIKIYHYEKESDGIIEIYNANGKILVTELSRIELMSAVHRKFREGFITENILEILINKINYDFRSRFTMLYFSNAVIETAIDIILRYNRKNFLRTLDAIQLSFYELHCEKDDVFVCFDSRLNQVAEEKNIKFTKLTYSFHVIC